MLPVFPVALPIASKVSLTPVSYGFPLSYGFCYRRGYTLVCSRSPFCSLNKVAIVLIHRDYNPA